VESMSLTPFRTLSPHGELARSTHRPEKTPTVYCRTGQMFHEHFAAITTLLNAEDREEQQNLIIYMVAKSYPKLLRRLHNEIHSQPYLERIQAVNRVQVEGRDFPLPHPIASRKGQRDIAFLQAISNPQNRFLSRLSNVNIFRLTKIATEYSAGAEIPQIYTGCRVQYYSLQYLESIVTVY
jgi:hypothetical protein